MDTSHFIASKNQIYYNSKVKYLSNGSCKVTCFNKPIYKAVGWESTENKHLPDKTAKSRSDTNEVRSDSVKRAKDKIFEIALANEWNYMVTFTLDESKVNRYDSKEVKRKFCKWLENMVQRKGLKALIVPELHKDGAIHFHGLINDSLDLVHSGTYKVTGKKKPVRLSTLKKMKLTPGSENVRDVYNITNYKLGFATAVELDGNKEAVSFYMTKYATKELDLHKILGKFYLAVGDIKRELPYELLDLDFREVEKIGKVVDLPEHYGQVCYASIPVEDLKGFMI